LLSSKTGTMTGTPSGTGGLGEAAASNNVKRRAWVCKKQSINFNPRGLEIADVHVSGREVR
jgi:hypothetical protein